MEKMRWRLTQRLRINPKVHRQDSARAETYRCTKEKDCNCKLKTNLIQRPQDPFKRKTWRLKQWLRIKSRPGWRGFGGTGIGKQGEKNRSPDDYRKKGMEDFHSKIRQKNIVKLSIKALMAEEFDKKESSSEKKADEDKTNKGKVKEKNSESISKIHGNGKKEKLKPKLRLKLNCSTKLKRGTRPNEEPKAKVTRTA